MRRGVVGRAVSGFSKARNFFIFRVKLVPEDKDTQIPRNIRKILEHLHFHQYQCEGWQITDDEDLCFAEGLEGCWEDFRAKKLYKMNRNEKRDKKNTSCKIYSTMVPKSISAVPSFCRALSLQHERKHWTPSRMQCCNYKHKRVISIR